MFNGIVKGEKFGVGVKWNFVERYINVFKLLDLMDNFREVKDLRFNLSSERLLFGSGEFEFMIVDDMIFFGVDEEYFIRFEMIFLNDFFRFNGNSIDFRCIDYDVI